ncbi:MAG: exo-alpha-sialidase [Candidatus Hydrogenedentes bacterium]|nr:exo-alpha-sialidase [Candidatus Hydrogenedentota bacterium]
MRSLIAALCLLSCALFASAGSLPAALLLAPSAENPRNSEGDFIGLKDGRILFIYTHFTGGSGDDATAHLASRVSLDGGKTWSGEDVVVLANDARYNIMSVSLLRLDDDRIAMLYLRKDDADLCMPLLRYSTDEAATWPESIDCAAAFPGYYVVNNDRMIQLADGRLVMPAARHGIQGEPFRERAEALCLLSDDRGATWRISQSRLEAPAEIRSGLQEPGVVQLKDGSLLMLCRTSGGCQYVSRSADGGETWSSAAPTGLASPVSPATVQRIPSTGDLLLLWNDHTALPLEQRDKRTPLTAALSKDEGKTWRVVKTLEDLASGWYCYSAVHFTEDAVLLGYCAGDRTTGNGLDTTKVARLPVSGLYAGWESAAIIPMDP